MDWYALHVPGGGEEKAVELLEAELGDAFRFSIYRRVLNERKAGLVRPVVRKLFPGYILMYGRMTDKAKHQLNDCLARCHILENNGEYLTLRPQEVAMLDLLDGGRQDGLIAVSSAYMEGDQIVVTEGAMKGQESRIISVNRRKGRVKFLIDFLGDERVIELGVEWIRKSV